MVNTAPPYNSPKIMANVIKLKKSIVAGNIPTTANLALGEGAINHTDQKIYFRHPGTGAVWNFAGGSITTGSVDNSILRADGTSGATLQNSGLIVEDAIVSITGITGDALTDVITATGSAFSNGQPVRFTALTGGTGLNTTTNYFVRDVSGATFKLETSIGGGAINFTTNITAGTLLTGHSVSTNVTLSENTTATNSALVLAPKGTGAFILGPKPDGTTTGGNARGAKAVDLQLSRTAATQVASGGESVICGGKNNTASGAQSVICAGEANTCIALGSIICSGLSNQCSAADYNALVGGVSNNVSATLAFIGAGRSNLASGNASVIAGGGDGAIGNTASASNSAILGGSSALANRIGMQAHANGSFSGTSGSGDAQRARFVLRCKTTTNTGVEMALNGATTYLGIPSGKIIACTINITGSKSDGTAVAHYLRQYCVKNIGGTSSQVYAPVTIGTDNAAGTTIALSANNADDTLRISVTGITSETWRWVASVDAVEVAYGT